MALAAASACSQATKAAHTPTRQVLECDHAWRGLLPVHCGHADLQATVHRVQVSGKTVAHVHLSVNLTVNQAMAYKSSEQRMEMPRQQANIWSCSRCTALNPHTHTLPLNQLQSHHTHARRRERKEKRRVLEGTTCTGGASA